MTSLQANLICLHSHNPLRPNAKKESNYLRGWGCVWAAFITDLWEISQQSVLNHDTKGFARASQESSSKLNIWKRDEEGSFQSSDAYFYRVFFVILRKKRVCLEQEVPDRDHLPLNIITILTDALQQLHHENENNYGKSLKQQYIHRWFCQIW